MPLTLRLGTYLLQTAEDEDLQLLQSAVALLRTVFSDHYVDPDHKAALFFHGRTLPGRRHDFTVIHRGEHVVLTDFTFPTTGPRTVKVPLLIYARDIAQFAQQVLAASAKPATRPDWQQRYVEAQQLAVSELLCLAEQLLSEGQEAKPQVLTRFHEKQGATKRPLELQIKTVAAKPEPWQPVAVVAKAEFGPIRLQERIPVKLNGGDTILATVESFKPDGIHLTLEGIGNGGVCPGDRLIGLQLFYP